MKYIFFGTPRFAEIILDGLIRDGTPPVALVCNPDRPLGRKKVITPPPAKALAVKNSPDIEILQPEKIDDAFLRHLAALNPDFFVVAAYAKILPKALLDIPRLGTLGVHPSLLPKYRGASPIQSAILSGTEQSVENEIRTGATIYLMDKKTDHGAILAQAAIAITPTNYLTVEEKLADLSRRLLIETLPNFLAGKVEPRIQDESQATYTKKFRTEDGYIEPKDLARAASAIEILRKIHALNPEPGAWTLHNGRRIKLLEGMISSGRLVLTLIQRDGEKPKHGEFSNL